MRRTLLLARSRKRLRLQPEAFFILVRGWYTGPVQPDLPDSSIISLLGGLTGLVRRLHYTRV